MASKKIGFPAVIHSSRDLGREGFRGCSPWARQGIFIFTEDRIGQSESTPEQNHAKSLANNNKWQKTEHEFQSYGTAYCAFCIMLPEGHDRLMKKLRGEKLPEAKIENPH